MKAQEQALRMEGRRGALLAEPRARPTWVLAPSKLPRPRVGPALGDRSAERDRSRER